MRIKLCYEDEEREEAAEALAGSKYAALLSEFDHYLRNKIKYEGRAEDVHSAFQEARDELWKLRDEYEIPGE